MEEEKKIDFSGIRYKLRIRLYRNDLMFGPGVAELMELVEETGSLSKACQKMGMAYSKGWKIIRRAQLDLGVSLLQGHTGGKSGGSTELTEEGRVVLQKFRAFEKALCHEADRIFEEVFEEKANE